MSSLFKYNATLGDVVDKDEVNQLFDDFEQFIDTAGLSPDLVAPESILYKHFEEPPLFLLADVARGIGQIGNFVGPGYNIALPYISFETAFQVSMKVTFEVWYFGYDVARDGYISLAVRDKGTGIWNEVSTPNGITRRRFGWGKSDPNNYSMYDNTQQHYWTGAAGAKPHSADMKKPNIIQGMWGPSSNVYKTLGDPTLNDRYGFGIDPGNGFGGHVNKVHAFDVAFLFMIAQDYA